MLLVHGIGAEKTQFLPAVGELQRAGYHVFSYDQRNHGESGGATTTLGAVVGTHAGPGTVGFFWFEDDE